MNFWTNKKIWIFANLKIRASASVQHIEDGEPNIQRPNSNIHDRDATKL